MFANSGQRNQQHSYQSRANTQHGMWKEEILEFW